MSAWEMGEASSSKAAEFLEERADEILEFARLLIRTPSPNPPGDERAVATVVRDRLRSFGLESHELSGAVGRSNIVAVVEGGRPGPRLILSGHLDTKPAGDLNAWTADPWESDGRDQGLRGLGSGDMKAAIAGMVYALGALSWVGLPRGSVTIVLTADEESGSTWGADWLTANGLVTADAVIIGEPSGFDTEWEALHTVSRGASLFRVRVTGTQMHSSISDRYKPINASVKMAGLMSKMHNELRRGLTFTPHRFFPNGPTVNVGVMASAGTYYGIYPGHAEFACDVRTLPGMTRVTVEREISGFLQEAMRLDPDLVVEVEFDGWIDATEIDDDHPIVRAILAVAQEALGTTPRLDGFPGGTDATYFQGVAGIPTVPAVGPGLLPRAHSPNEWLHEDGPRKAARLYALAALEYVATERPQ